MHHYPLNIRDLSHIRFVLRYYSMYCIVDRLGMMIYLYPAPGGVLEVQGLPVTSGTALLVSSYFKAGLGSAQAG